MPLPSTDNAKQSLTIRLLPPLQFLQKLLENSQKQTIPHHQTIAIQSSASLPSHLPKYTSIKHRHFGSDFGASATHRQRQTIFYHQAIASTLILAESLKNFWRYFQSSASLPSHLPKYTSIKHCHFRSDCGTSAIHRQCQTIPHHQAVVFTLILAEIARELAKAHPVRAFSCTSQTHLDRIAMVWKQYGAATTIHQQCQTVPHYQANSSTPTLMENNENL